MNRFQKIKGQEVSIFVPAKSKSRVLRDLKKLGFSHCVCGCCKRTSQQILVIRSEGTVVFEDEKRKSHYKSMADFKKEKLTLMFPMIVTLNKEYDAKVYKDVVEVGCRKFTYEAVFRLAKVLEKIKK